MNETCGHLDRFIEGVLDTEQRAEFSVHLSQCEQCQAEIALSIGLDRRFREAWASIEAPHHLRASFEQSIETATGVEKSQATGVSTELRHKEVRSRQSRFAALNWSQWVIGGAVAAAAIGAVVMLSESGFEGQRAGELARGSQRDSPAEAVITPELVAVSPVAFALPENSDGAIMVPSPVSNQRFTIVTAHPVFKPAVNDGQPIND